MPRQNPDAAFRVLGEEAIIVTPSTREREGRLFTLSPVGTRIWELCDGTRTVGDIARSICEEFEVDRAVAERDTAGFIEEMEREGLVAC